MECTFEVNFTVVNAHKTGGSGQLAGRPDGCRRAGCQDRSASQGVCVLVCGVRVCVCVCV